ncbi:MAG: sensor domain-containing diguanylate cyclase [Nevskiaceae bacterium]|nr:MAG: sensor domain-containing diguanylate cyclase [Nevskiaceae bacterium]TBR72052.1 MAG: sensor domain-containing diguanylate cyclase [Nevskiaceae bacterium]
MFHKPDVADVEAQRILARATGGMAAAAVPVASPSSAVLLSALAQAGYGVIVTDADARVRWLNDAAQSLTGWLGGDALGQRVFSVFRLEDDQGEVMPSPVEAALAEHDVGLRRYSGWLCARDGTREWVDAQAVACFGIAGGERDGQAVLWFEDAGARQRARRAVQRRTEIAEAVINELAEAVLLLDATGRVQRANARALRMFGYGSAEMGQLTIARLMPVPFMNAPDVQFTEYRTNPSRRLPRAVAWRKDATHFPARLVVEPLPVMGDDGGYVALVRDDTETQRSVNMAQRLGRLLDSAVEEIYVFDANSLYFLEVNRGAQRNLGYTNEELRTMTPLMVAEGLAQETLLGYLAQLRGGDREHLVYRTRHRRADGTVYPVEVRLNFSRDEEPPVFMAMAVDISDREAQEKEMSHLAHFDALTGLPNRPQLMLRLQAAMALAASSPKQLAVMFMDIDKFKVINDTCGHDVGDEVLRAVAQRLREALRTADTVARLGGDEFVVLAEGINNNEDATRVVEKLQAAVAQPVAVGGQQLPIAFSIGITLYPNDNADMETLLKHADEAMYAAKHAGRGTHRFYEILRPDTDMVDTPKKSRFGPHLS